MQWRSEHKVVGPRHAPYYTKALIDGASLSQDVTKSQCIHIGQEESVEVTLTSAPVLIGLLKIPLSL